VSASLTSMREFIDVFRRRVPPGIHPSAQCIVREYISRAYDADARGDLHEVSRLLGLAKWKICDELRWEAEKYSDQLIRDYRESYRLRHRADRFEARQ
jgi:hypothetical protein